MSPLPKPTPQSSWPDDEHAFCPPPCRGLMVFDAVTGLLRCDRCGLLADADIGWQEVPW